MIEARLIGVLSILQEKIPAGVNWAVAGSCNLALRGIDVRVHDIDLVTGKEGAYAIEKLFSPVVTKRVEFSTEGKIRSYFGTTIVNTVKVDIIGDSQFLLTDGTWTPVRDIEASREIMDFNGKPLPLLRLEDEYHGYRDMGKLQKAALVLKYLKNSGV